jgi:cell division protease FtsH
MTLGGRAAEQIIFGKISTGALSDLERITKLAYSMVTMYGMNDKIGNVSFYDSKQSDYSFNKPYSEATSSFIDQEVKRIIDHAYLRTITLLKDKQDQLEKIAQALLLKEILFQSDLTDLIGARPFEKATHYHEFTTSTGQYLAKPDVDTIKESEAKEQAEKIENEKAKAPEAQPENL